MGYAAFFFFLNWSPQLLFLRAMVRAGAFQVKINLWRFCPGLWLYKRKSIFLVNLWKDFCFCEFLWNESWFINHENNHLLQRYFVLSLAQKLTHEETSITKRFLSLVWSPDLKPIQHILLVTHACWLSIFNSVPKSPLTNGRTKRSRLMLISWKWDITPSHMDALILLDVDYIFMFFVLLTPPSTLSSLLESLQILVKQAVRCKSQGSFIFLMGAMCLCNTRLPFVLVTDKITEEKKTQQRGQREKRGWG